MMHARVTLLEIDTMRVDPDRAVELFEELVLPELREQEGYEGVFVLATPEGKGLVISLWTTEEFAKAHSETGFYPAQLERFMTLFRSPPDRERYRLALADVPTASQD